jgi:hypothetical protein
MKTTDLTTIFQEVVKARPEATVAEQLQEALTLREEVYSQIQAELEANPNVLFVGVTN